MLFSSGLNCPTISSSAVALKPGTICVMPTAKPRGKYNTNMYHGNDPNVVADAELFNTMLTTLITIGSITPTSIRIMCFGLRDIGFISSKIIGYAPIINPANKQIILNGIRLYKYCTAKKPITKPTTPPIAIGNRNAKQDLNSFSILPKAYSRLAYKPNIMAIVEPLTPGTIIASPIKKPRRALLNQDFVLYFCKFSMFTPKNSVYSIFKSTMLQADGISPFRFVLVEMTIL